VPKPIPPAAFVSLRSLTQGTPDPQAALAEIRRIYFATTRQTIDHDLAHAIELLKALPGEEEREKASVYMEGLSQMQREWQAQTRRKNRTPGAAQRPRRPRKPGPE
jgi:hypothetical protein